MLAQLKAVIRQYIIGKVAAMVIEDVASAADLSDEDRAVIDALLASESPS